jgi:hypothetical protein
MDFQNICKDCFLWNLVMKLWNMWSSEEKKIFEWDFLEYFCEQISGELYINFIEDAK